MTRVTIKCINLKIVYSSSYYNHTRLMTGTFKLAVPEGSKSLPFINSHIVKVFTLHEAHMTMRDLIF